MKFDARTKYQRICADIEEALRVITAELLTMPAKSRKLILNAIGEDFSIQAPKMQHFILAYILRCMEEQDVISHSANVNSKMIDDMIEKLTAESEGDPNG